jgi:small-conductance mechanosensitive channel
MPETAMSQESIYSTLYAALALTDSIFQIWLTLTFAVVVATYVAERRFDRGLYRLVSCLYAFASAILFTRFASAAYQAFHYKNLLRARGFDPWPVPNIVSLVIGVGTFVLLFAGTLGTLWFVRSTWKRGSVAQSPNP